MTNTRKKSPGTARQTPTPGEAMPGDEIDIAHLLRDHAEHNRRLGIEAVRKEHPTVARRV